MCILVTLALQGTLIASTLGTNTGCKTCKTEGTSGSVTSALSYTEPTAAASARVARIQAGTDTPDLLAAEAARGTGRVTGEARTFDRGRVSVYSNVVTLESTVSYDAKLDVGGVVPIGLSYVTVKFDYPATAGKTTLADLHAKVCESVTVPGDAGAYNEQTSAVCGDVLGTIDLRPSGSAAFDADLVFTPRATTDDSPALSGTAHIHHEDFVDTSVCPDLGGGSTPMFGLE